MPRRPALTRFARILLTMGSGESPWLIVAFVLGVIALGVFSNFVYGLAANPFSISWSSVLCVPIAVAVLIGSAYAAYHHDLTLAWQSRKFNATFDEKRIAPPHAGLIWLLSRGSLDLPLMAMRHHHTSQTPEHLRHCWVLLTPGAQEIFDQLAARVSELGYDVVLHPVHLETVTIEATYRAVDDIYTVKASGAGLSPDQIIADLTGGLKTMTAGMVLACLPHGRSIEYIESMRDPVTGDPIQGTQRPILVGVDFTLGK